MAVCGGYPAQNFLFGLIFDIGHTPSPSGTFRKKFRKNLERVEKTPTPKISGLLRKRPVLLRANFVLTKARKRPYYGHFCGQIHREGSCSKAAGGP